MTDHWLFYLVVAIPGSALGGWVRYHLSGYIARRHGERFPVGTLVVNITGAFLIGLVVSMPWEAILSAGIGDPLRLFLMYGVLGGFTTVSSFSLQTFNLLQEGEWQKAGLNVILSVGGCLIAVVAGVACGRFLA